MMPALPGATEAEAHFTTAHSRRYRAQSVSIQRSKFIHRDFKLSLNLKNLNVIELTKNYSEGPSRYRKIIKQPCLLQVC